MERPSQSFLHGHSEQLGDQRDLPSHIPFVHPLHLPFAHHVHRLKLYGIPTSSLGSGQHIVALGSGEGRCAILALLQGT